MANKKPRNFSAGPAILPPPVYARAAAAVTELQRDGHLEGAPGIGLSLLEISHRSPEYTQINNELQALCHEVIGIPENYEILTLQGGASLQFAMIPLNLKRAGKAAGFINTGTWTQKAIRESQVVQDTKVLASSEETTFDHIPEFPALDGELSYLHIASNNTIFGTEYAAFPDSGDVPLVIDASSDIASRKMDYAKAKLIFAGAQKNLGPSGVTLIAIEKDFLAGLEADDKVPHYLRYGTHVAKQSLYNTPNTFGGLVLKLMLEWMKSEGGVEEIARRNDEKAKTLYDFIDGSSLFKGHARPDSRSKMNVTFRLASDADNADEPNTKAFLAAAAEAGFVGLKGHRSVGGCRASIYNAFPVEGVRELVEFMGEYERKA
jgi:phosphoserine aminotransferase